MSAAAITTVASILAIVNIVGNSLVCAIVKKNRDMRTPMNYLLVNLAVADILYATFIIPKVLFKLIFTHPVGVTGTFLCKFLIRGTVAWVGGVSSILTLVVIAIERHYAAVHPFKWNFTKRRLKGIIACIWIFALIFNIPMFLVVDSEKVDTRNLCVYVWPENWMGKAYSWTWFVLTVFSLALMIVLYCRIIYTLWFKSNDHNQYTHQQKAAIRMRKRVTLMVVTVSTIFGICWGAESIEYVLRNLPSLEISPIVVAIVDTMVLFNSGVNPFVYALFNQQFKEKLKKMICCTVSSAYRVHRTPKVQDIQLADRTIQLTRTVGAISTE